MKTIASLAFLAALLAVPAHAELRGSDEARARAALMMERLGGAETWANARTLYLVYSGWRTGPDAPMIEEAWRDLTTPYTVMTYRRERDAYPDVEFHQRPDRSWLIVRGERRPFDANENAENQRFWHYDFYTVLRRLAAGDEAIAVALDDNRLTLTGPAGEDWGWFQIDDTGQPVRWGAMSDGEPLEYIYGPVVPFGDIAFPAWGTSVTGDWRFAYETVSISRDAPPDMG